MESRTAPSIDTVQYLGTPKNEEILPSYMLYGSTEKYIQLKAKYKALKLENERLVSLLNLKDNTCLTLLSNLKNLENEFKAYKLSCEKMLKSLTAKPSIAKKIKSLTLLVTNTPHIADLHKNIIPLVYQVNDLVNSGNLKSAIKAVLAIIHDIVINFRTRPLKKPLLVEKDNYLKTLSKESEYLLKSINRQINKLTYRD